MTNLTENTKLDSSGCLLWVSGKNDRGYGYLYINKKQILAHRYVWQRYKGPIPKGIGVLHKCDTPACVNLDHLFLGTQADNNYDRERKGRGVYLKGEEHGRAKLTNNEVIEIRKKFIPHKYTYKDLAKEYNVSKQLIGFILTKRNWKHL